jgi:1,2-diacylglycerol 3-alpha-glucosyltransferase
MTHRSPLREPLRIAVVAACPFPSARGSQVLIRELAQALADVGHQVHVVTYPFGETLVPLRGLFVHRVPGRPGATVPIPLGWSKVLMDLRLAVILHRVVRRERIQVMHAHNYEGPLVSYAIRRLTGVPVVYHSHNALSDELEYYFRPGWRRVVANRLGRLLDRLVPRRADFVIALTPELGRFLCERGVALRRLAVIPPAVTQAPMAQGPVCRSADSFDGRFVVMYSGNLDPYQDLEVLCEAFEQFRKGVSQALLVVVTHDINWERRAGRSLQALLENDGARGLAVKLFSQVRGLLSRADVLVCPRSSWSGFPIKLINYMAAGRPVIAAEGSAKGIIDGENGLVFRNRDVAGLAAALRRLFADAALRQRLGDRARAASAAFGDRMQAVGQIERVYDQLRAPADAQLSTRSLPSGLRALAQNRISVTAGGGPGNARD